jgi:hypothetical protein
MFVQSGIRPLPDIRPDIWYLAFGLTGYLASRILGKNSIRCIPSSNQPSLKWLPTFCQPPSKFNFFNVKKEGLDVVTVPGTAS